MRLAVSLVALLLVGCYQSHGPVGSESDAGGTDCGTCPRGTLCRGGECVPIGVCECTSDSDCPAVGCLRPVCDECACFIDPDSSRCAPGEVCNGDGVCVSAGGCMTDADCPSPPPGCGRAVCDHCQCLFAPSDVCDGVCDPESLECVGDGGTVALTVRSDFEPGTEIAHIRIASRAGHVLGSRSISADTPLLGGVDFGPFLLPAGPAVLSVQGLGPDKNEVIERSLMFSAGRPVTLTVLLTRP